jgi:molybdopterin/thiamine biosynthesis adenylyltransferase
VSSWWERFPGRLEAELEAFRDRSLEFVVDDALFRDAGRVLLRGAITYGGDSVRLEVLYPDLFPYLRPEVYAPDLALTRHQNPREHNLCLLDRSTRFWVPSDTAAWLVGERVPLLLSLFSEGAEAMAAAEAPQGEPASAYFHTQLGAAVFIPEAVLEVPAEHRVGSGHLRFAVEVPPRVVIRGLLGELVVKPRSGKSRRVAQADELLAGRFGGRELSIRWARLDQPPSGFDAEAIFAAAEAVQPGFGRPPWQAVTDGEVAIVGLVFPEEVRQGEFEDTWVFGVRVPRRAAGRLQEASYVVRGERLTREDLATRIPAVTDLAAATVAIAGLGAIGAPVALELARNQAGVLRLLEHDIIEAAQTVRYPFGLTAVGHPKLDVVAHYIETNHPFTRVERFAHRLGQTALDRRGRSEDEFVLVQRFLAGADLLVDATAEIAIQQLLAETANDLGLVQLFVSATEGARGGQISRLVPGVGGCWHCWKHHVTDGTIDLPPRDENGAVQPRGCADATFTGTSFDLLPIVAQAVRGATATVRHAARDQLTSVVWVCSIPNGGETPPAWIEYPVDVHPRCARCGAG